MEFVGRGTIDGNKVANPTFGYGLRIYGYGFILRDLRVRNCNHACIYSEWSTSSAPPAPDSMEAQMANVKARDSSSDNIEWVGPHDSAWTNVISYNAGSHGVWVRIPVNPDARSD